MGNSVRGHCDWRLYLNSSPFGNRREAVAAVCYRQPKLETGEAVMHCLRFVVVAAFACGLANFLDQRSAQGHVYELFGPSGLVSAKIDAFPGQLIVYQRNGERITYTRDYQYDSPDRRFFGYYNFPLARILRFPASGYGVMQIADLDDVIPVYRFTQRWVRPARQLSGPLPPAILGPVFVPPPIFPNQNFGFGFPIDPGFQAGTVYVPPPVAPQRVVLESRTIPHPPLPPAVVRLRNSGPRELMVTIVDHKQPGLTGELRIGPGSFQEAQLIRDAGETVVEKVQVISPNGDSSIQDVQQEIPPASRYEIVVHEIRLQSIAIDRTPGGNNAIEDVNQTGKGLGRFDLPPGPDLGSGTIDVFQAARSKNNAETITPILATEDATFRLDPLERSLMDARNQSQRGR